MTEGLGDVGRAVEALVEAERRRELRGQACVRAECARFEGLLEAEQPEPVELLQVVGVGLSVRARWRRPGRAERERPR